MNIELKLYMNNYVKDTDSCDPLVMCLKCLNLEDKMELKPLKLDILNIQAYSSLQCHSGQRLQKIVDICKTSVYIIYLCLNRKILFNGI